MRKSPRFATVLHATAAWRGKLSARISRRSRPVARPPRPELAALSGVRGIAAYAVIATHAGFESGRSLDGGPFGPFLARLNFGVTLFFLLSGFLLSRQFMTDTSRLSPARIGQFWRRRGLRVLPAYWLAIIGTLWLLSTEHSSGLTWISYLLLVQTYDHHYVNNSLSQTWTLVVEVSFYALLPLLIWASRRIPRPRHQQTTVLVLVMSAAALAANLFTHFRYGGSSLSLLWLPEYLDWFALGILLASLAVEPATTRWRRVLSEWSTSPGTCWIVGALCFWLLTLPLGGPLDVTPASTWEWTMYHVLAGASAFFFLLPLTQGRSHWADSLLGNPTMQWLGEISYGVYLWHLGLLIAIARWFGWPAFSGHFVALFVLTALAATVVAGLSWHFVEQPLLRRFSSSWRPVVPDQAAVQNDADRHQAEQLHPRAAGQGMA
jgi:peptidoglycan/LPS O-acetylase OafA/YrhL